MRKNNEDFIYILVKINKILASNDANITHSNVI